jgi:hypothetical protein
MTQKACRWPILAAVCLAVLLPCQGAAQGRGQGFRPCPYTPYVCKPSRTCKPFRDTGKVAQVRTESLQEGMYPGTAILVDTRSHGQVLVHLGPVWYLERQEFTLDPGDQVEINGMCDKLDGKNVVVAKSLTKGNYVLELRDDLGRPRWEAWRRR